MSDIEWLEFFAFIGFPLLVGCLLLILFFRFRRNRKRIQVVFKNDSSKVLKDLKWSYDNLKAGYIDKEKQPDGKIEESVRESFWRLQILNESGLASICKKAISGNLLDAQMETLLLRKKRFERFMEASLFKEEYKIQINCIDRVIEYIKHQMTILGTSISESASNDLVDNEIEEEDCNVEDPYSKYPELTEAIFLEALKSEANEIFEKMCEDKCIKEKEDHYQFNDESEQVDVIRPAIKIWDKKLIDRTPFKNQFKRFAYCYMRFIEYRTIAKDPYDQFKQEKLRHDKEQLN
jgi:hypothetical protein